MTSPYSSGGGGPLFEATVVSYYLAALLCEMPARGTRASSVTEVRSQRGDLGAPLDDIVVVGVEEDGTATELHLQIKNRLSFTVGDKEWIDVLGRAWDTCTATGFDAARILYGAGIGRYSARADEEYQPVLDWARHSVSAADFFLRIEKKDFSSTLKIAFVQTIRDALSAHAQRAVTDDEVWRFLRNLLIIHFDFQIPESSRDAESLRDRLRALFVDEPVSHAGRLWDHLIAQASRLMPLAGSVDRSTLRQQMRSDGFSLAESSSKRRRALLVLQQESLRALAEIKSEIVGLRVHRRAASAALRRALDTARLIQITGEPGTGKSALLKEFAEECARLGPVFVLKDARIHPRGWAAHAHVLGVTSDCAELLTDLANTGEPILFIDGIDKIVDPAVQITVNDVLRTVTSTPHLSAWKVVMTVREQNLWHLESWIDERVLKALPLASIAVGTLDSDERDTVGAYFPRLRPLLTQTGIDAILLRPFFLDALLALGAQSSEELPATEVALLQLWWSFGGTDQKGIALAQEQRDTLIALGERLAQSPGKAIAMGGLSSPAIERLLTAGVLRDGVLGHSVLFAHDIFEEWTLCETLIRHRSDVQAFVRSAGEAEILVRPVQLLGTYLLETEATSEGWEKLIAECAASDLRSVWQRAVLLSCLQSTRASRILDTLTPYLTANDAQELRKLMLALRTIEVVPNAQFLNELQTPDIEAAERAKYANLTAQPRVTPWIRFLDWLMAHISSLPLSIVPDILPIFFAWQRRYAGRNVRHCREIGVLSGEWLARVEQELHPESFDDRRDPLGLNLPYRDGEKFESSLRETFLGSAAENPELVTAYLKDKAQAQHHVHTYRDGIMESAVSLAMHVPTALVDFMLETFLTHPQDHTNDAFYGYASFEVEKVGIPSDHRFYPASPVQIPFLLLLRMHESEGLRLVHGFCNHSIEVWRWIRPHWAHYAPATPLPVSVTFDGKLSEFWGDKQVYQWFRGVWGNHAVGSALMALEWWALQELDAGAPFAEVFAKVVSPNVSVAALGIAVSLCLAFPDKSLPQSASLICCPQLWEWDIARWMGDRHSANQIGNWFQHRRELSATKQSNERQHRQRELRELVPKLIFGSDHELRQRVIDGIAAFPQHLPFEYEEEKTDPARVAALAEKTKIFAERGDPSNWRMQQHPDGNTIVIWCDPPSAHTEEHKTQSDDYLRLNEYSALIMWAQRTLDNTALDLEIVLADGWRRAQVIDVKDAFAATENFPDQQRAVAIAGVAFVLASYAEDDLMLSWAAQSLRRAVSTPELASTSLVRSSILPMHPIVFASHGYSALLARQSFILEAQTTLLRIALHPIEHLAATVFVGMTRYAERYPKFCWVLIDLAIGRSLCDRSHVPSYDNIIPDVYEERNNQRLWHRARRALAKGKIPQLPAIPMPWIKPSRWMAIKQWLGERWPHVAAHQPIRHPSTRDTEGYETNPRVFIWNVVQKLVFQAPTARLMASPDGVKRIFSLASQMRDFTIMKVVPPFVDTRRDFRGQTPFEWVFDCASWLGDVLAALPDLETKKQLIAPILDAERETALMMLQTVMRRFMFRALTTPAQISEADLALWQYLADWVLANPEGSHPKNEYLDREYTDCVFSLLFCARADFLILRCAISQGWPHLHLFRSTIEKTVAKLGVNTTVFRALTTLLNQGGRDWLPEPALGWIENVVEARKGDVEFWQAHGEDTVSLLTPLVTAHPQSADALHLRIIRVSDTLVDAGVRGAGFMQQELLRET